MKLGRISLSQLVLIPFLCGCATAHDVTDGANLCSVYDPNNGDLIFLGAGNSTLYGGRGIDIAVFPGKRSSYVIVRSGMQAAVIGANGINILGLSIELLEFDDMVLNLFAVMSRPEPSGASVLQQIPVWSSAENLREVSRNTLLARCR